MINKAKSAIIFCLGDDALREVVKHRTIAPMWMKLESLYIMKSLTHRLFLKKQLYLFKMTKSRMMIKQLANFANFKNILDDVENI